MTNGSKLDWLELLDGFAAGQPVTVEHFGGPAAMLGHFDALLEHDAVSATEILCGAWRDFTEGRVDARAALARAAAFDGFDADDVQDIILTTEAVVAEAFAELTAVFRTQAKHAGLIGDISTESWVRLAIGGWCSSMPVRSHVEERLLEAATAGNTSAFLVRAGAAVWERWHDTEIEEAFAALQHVDEFSSTILFERGMDALAQAAAASDPAASVERLRQTVWFLEQAGERVDALAYVTPLRGLVRFLDGGDVTAAEVQEAQHRVHEYLLGYRGLNSHWRQGRADASRGWSMLLEMLAAAEGMHDTTWFSAADVIEAGAALYAAETAVSVVARNDPSPVKPGRDLARKHVYDVFSANPSASSLLDKWLSRSESQQSPLHAAVLTLRDALQEVDPATVAAADASVDDVEEAVRTLLAGLQAAQRPASFAETLLLRRVIADIEAIVPTETQAVASSLTAVVLTLIQMTQYLLNMKQSGERKIAWLGGGPNEKGRFPKEYVLSEQIISWFQASGLRVQAEAVNVGGGDVDVAIRFPLHTFYIEVKRVTTTEGDRAASDHYGDQATQYAATDIPIVFLALLDYVSRAVRVDLNGVVWTVEHQPDPQSRVYALTGFRVQANVASPSAASRRPRRRGRS